MRHKNLIILFFIVFLSIAYAEPSFYSVKYVYDGDTILIDNGEKVRYLGIDAPEMGHKGGVNEFMALTSKEYNLFLVGNKRVRLEFDEEVKDRHGRLLAFVFLENGDMVNGILVRKGLAHLLVKGPKFKYFSLLLGYQRRAMSEKLGLWKNQPANPEPYYIGNSKSFRFHRPTCPFGNRILQKNLVKFKKYQDAFWDGFSPCKRCRP